VGYKLSKGATPSQVEDYNSIERFKDAIKRIAKVEKKQKKR
jgi:hypothetical protein